MRRTTLATTPSRQDAMFTLSVHDAFLTRDYFAVERRLSVRPFVRYIRVSKRLNLLSDIVLLIHDSLQIFSIVSSTKTVAVLFTLKAHHNPIIFHIFINHANTIIVMKLCQIKQN